MNRAFTNYYEGLRRRSSPLVVEVPGGLHRGGGERTPIQAAIAVLRSYVMYRNKVLTTVTPHTKPTREGDLRFCAVESWIDHSSSSQDPHNIR